MKYLLKQNEVLEKKYLNGGKIFHKQGNLLKGVRPSMGVLLCVNFFTVYSYSNLILYSVILLYIIEYYRYITNDVYNVQNLHIESPHFPESVDLDELLLKAMKSDNKM